MRINMTVRTDITKHYTYPDIDDALTTSLINLIEPFEGYWEQSERYILNIIKKYLQKRARKENSFFLDAGCGDGRLLSEFKGFFDNVVAIDPDIKRLQIAEESLQKQVTSSKISFKPIAIEQLDDNQKFDFILCSHVLQHINADNVQLILRKLKSLLKKNGLLAIMTGHSDSNQDKYLKNYFKNSEIIEEIISKEEFNSLICNNSRVLPIHLFSSQNITQILTNLHLKILEIKSFHILLDLYGLDHLIFRDRLLNYSEFFKQRVGRDMLILATLNSH